MFDDAVQQTPIAFGAVRRNNPEERMYPDSTNMLPTSGRGATASQLDSPDAIALHRKLLGYYQRELDRQAENRLQQAEDEDFYDNEQWSEEDKRVLEERGQAPLVYNVISTTVNWVLGTEKRARTDFKVLPRRKDAGKPAERKTQILKYLSDVNRTPFHRSRAFEDCAKVGVGWLEDGVQDEDDGEPIYSRYENWRNILWDSASTELDLSDARYVSRSKWLDYDVGAAIFPNRVAMIEEACVETGAFGTDWINGDMPMDSLEDAIDQGTLDRSGFARRRFRAIEMWFRRPTKVKRLRGGDFSGDVYDPQFQPHQDELDLGKAVLIDRLMMRMHVAIMTTAHLLYVGPSPYRHNEFPFTPIWCYRRGRDCMPYGIIRGLKGMQQDVNKRASKALHILSTNKVIMDAGAVPDLDEFREEVSRPDAIIVKNQGKEIILNADRDLAEGHIEMMSRSISMIQQASGVTDENLGRRTNAASGIAIGRRQEQGALATAGIFDNLRLAAQIQGEKQVSVVEQFMTEAKEFRITNMRGTPEYVTVNDGLPENDITATKADFIISEQDWRATVRQAQVDELLQLLQQLAPTAPQLALTLLDLVVEAMDIPQRDEIVRRIRQITGMRDPDAEGPTPEEIARQQEQQKQQQLNDAMAQAALDEKNASAAEKQARAAKAHADIGHSTAQTANVNADAMMKALQAAMAVLTAPAAAPVADRILHEGGFQSRSEQEADARTLGIMQGEAQQDLAAQQQQVDDQHITSLQPPPSPIAAPPAPALPAPPPAA